MGWLGHLDLTYRRDGGRTVAHDRHDGPMRVLAALYPEGPGICHHVLVHPPGGLVGGDELQLRVRVGPQAHALLTTPGATRFYRSAGAEALQDVQATVAAGGRLEWLPLETIAYSGTRAVNRQRFELEAGAQMMGWDLLALGLPAAGQGFERGSFEQHLELPGVWLERGLLDAGQPLTQRLLASPLGWDGQSVLATMWCASGTPWSSAERQALLDAAREGWPEQAVPRAGATSPDARVVVVRALADRSEPLWQALQGVRARWRRVLWDGADVAPRVWRT
ncbi:urease accessory protein UreD [Aquabacterium sp. A7-Y]|uniref:urease accessory protein UreD n=1 Tax=Aquabacterium sp. A7-Y TaxID=1349605 RepID=UPI00223E58B9|nr:urease accessory protein UreD [Aquabacterium sp. A7-Y]MCW7541676.1 urease accessory protein UreD [Aquabacterium sp. A7-Y]